jgi:hypothetical protein
MSRLSLSLSLAVALVSTTPALAQQPTIQQPVVPQPLATRRVHPCVADPVPGAFLNGAGPMFQYPDGLWNHGEGFAPGSQKVDYGGWFGDDNGAHVTGLDIHTDPTDPRVTVPNPWTNWTWIEPLHPSSGAALRRFYGYLRPDGVQLPTQHPRYGAVPAYVDSGAFELFRPVAGPGSRKIVVYVHTQATTRMPAQYVGSTKAALDRFQVYRGYFSPDGLVREELGPNPSSQTFVQNIGSTGLPVERPSLAVLGDWVRSPSSQYWILSAYPVMSVAHRQTTLNEQRYMQLVQAVKVLLQESSPRNPLYPDPPLSAAEVQSRVVVVFGGSSNGGHQAMWATQRYPGLVHGAFCEVMNPSIQRLFGEHDAGNAFAYLSGDAGATQVNESDFLHWGQYSWNQGRWIHDLSLTRRFAMGLSYRPMFFSVGDEDVTSTGTDWVGPASGQGWSEAGLVSSGASGIFSNHSFAWAIGENACHLGRMRIQNPYAGNSVTYFQEDAAAGLIAAAVAQRTAEGPTPAVNLLQPLAEDRQPAQQLRGLDDPHEWALGRLGESLPAASGGALARDDAWFAAVQPGAAGTWLGHEDAMLIRDHKVYVCGAEGVVSAFAVANTQQRELVRAAQSHLPGSTAVHSLGHEGFAMTSIGDGANWELIVGTRRHLHRLRGSDLEVLQSVLLPWEVSRPRHLTVGNVLPAVLSGATSQIIYTSIHGGLVFYSPQLQPLYEWPEPGIADFLVDSGSGTVTILSHRGVIADVQFESMGSGIHPKLLASSRSVPIDDAPGAQPLQGRPVELELLKANLSANVSGLVDLPVTLALYRGDTDNTAVRACLPIIRQTIPFVPGLSGGIVGSAIATCKEGTNSSSTEQQGIGDHLLVLVADSLALYSQIGVQIAAKPLYKTDQKQSGTSRSGHYPPGVGALGLVVGDLVTNPAGAVYQEEVVVATRTGSLMWMYIDELLAPGLLLPAVPGSGFWIDEAPAASGTAVLPRSNQCMSAVGALAGRSWEPVGGRSLHALDPRGAYWRISSSGQRELWARDLAVVDARGWDDLGNWEASGAQLPVTSSFFQGILEVFPPAVAQGLIPARLTHEVRCRPWCPVFSQDVQIERDLANPFRPDNWFRPVLPVRELRGFLVHRWSGSVLPWATMPTVPTDPTERAEAWFWSAESGSPWGDLVEGLRFAKRPTTAEIVGYWASSAWPTGVSASSPPPTASRVPYLEMRSLTTATAVMTSQAARAVRLPNGESVVVLNCPGGRLRSLSSFVVRPDNNTAHGGAVMAPSMDAGFGGSALAVRAEPSGAVTVWSAPLYAPMPRPLQYSNPSGTLGDSEVASSVVRRWTWAGGNFTPTAVRDLHPAGSDPRGGYGVTGILVADLLGEPGDEVVVATLGGDLFVFDEGLATLRFRTSVPGSLGVHNGLRALDLDSNGELELYVSGSFGIWRFLRSGV